MSKGIKLSEKHGLNPSLLMCECCGQEYGIAMLGKLKNDAKAPFTLTQGLCNDCKKVINSGGVMVIEVNDGESGDNPYRTGRIVGCSKIFKEANKIETPILYMEHKYFDNLFKDIFIKKED